MKNLFLYIIVIIIFSLLLKSCYKIDNFNKDTNEVFDIIKTERPEIEISKSQIENAMSAKSSTPCIWDFNLNGTIESSDLQTFLSNYGIIYNADDLVEFLSNYTESYTLDIVPAWNNYLGQTNCNNSFDALIRVNCNGNLQNFQNFDSLSWYYNNEFVTNDTQLKFLGATQDSICLGWELPCSGVFPNPIELRVYNNGHEFVRFGDSHAIQSGIDFCNNGFNVPNLFLGPFTPYEFCVNCN